MRGMERAPQGRGAGISGIWVLSGVRLHPPLNSVHDRPHSLIGTDTPDQGTARLAWPVDHASHHRDAREANVLFPGGDLAKGLFHGFRHAPYVAHRPSAGGAACDGRPWRPSSERPQDLETRGDLPFRRRGERGAERTADPYVEQDADRDRGSEQKRIMVLPAAPLWRLRILKRKSECEERILPGDPVRLQSA